MASNPMIFSQSTLIGNAATRDVVKKTYLLLSLTLLVSGLTAAWAMATHVVQHPLLYIIGTFGLYFATVGLRNNPIMGLVAVFAFTAFQGYTLGPLLTYYLHAYVNGGQIIMASLGATGAIFLSLTAYVWISKKDFSYLGGMIGIASMVVLIGALVSLFGNWPILNILVSGGIAVVSSGFILYSTHQIIQGGESNYLMATISLYISIFNLFVSLLRLISLFAGVRRD